MTPIRMSGPYVRARRLLAAPRGDDGAGQDVLPDAEIEHRGSGVLADAHLGDRVDVQGVHGDEVTVLAASGRRGRAQEAVRPGLVGHVEGTARQVRAVARSGGKLGGGG